MSVLQNAGDAAKGDQRGRKGGIKGLTLDKTVVDLNFYWRILVDFLWMNSRRVKLFQDCQNDYGAKLCTCHRFQL